MEQKQATEFGGYADSMRKDITKAESRIKSLRQQVDMAKARDSVQKAQVSASIASGGANGKLKGGRHLAYDRKTVTTGNLLVSILDMYGIQKDKQGDSTGPLPKLV